MLNRTMRYNEVTGNTGSKVTKDYAARLRSASRLLEFCLDPWTLRARVARG